jgi:CheY-like chemotaxis protein
VICFVVSDTGIGIPADRLDRLFSSFSQVDASTTRRYGGTGLGLAICKQLVEAMGGKISVESCVGEGSTFWFELPLEIVSQEGSQPPALPRELSSASVLVVDDNATNLEILTDQLSRWGLQVHTESSPASALRAMQEKSQRGEQFDLGILDCVMPEMSGLELAEQIRADRQLKDMRLMILSSLDDGVHVHEAERLGLRVLPKPIRQSRLYDALVSMTVKFRPKRRRCRCRCPRKRS